MKVEQSRRRLIAALLVCASVLAGVRLAAAADPPWLVRLNQYRATSRLWPVQVNEHLNAGEDDFARYLVKNFAQAIHAGRNPSADQMVEHVTNAGFSYRGFIASRASVAFIGVGPLRPEEMIDRWIADPMDRLPLLVPGPLLSEVAYQDFCENGICAAALYAQDHTEHMGVFGIEGGRQMSIDYGTAFKFPDNGAIVGIVSLGHQSPDFSKTCDFTPPVGLPITVQFGRWLAPKITSGWLTTGGKSVEACAFDALGYRSSTLVIQNNVRDRLGRYGAVVIVPRYPLRAGTKYTVHAVISDQTYDWSFSTSAKAVAVP